MAESKGFNFMAFLRCIVGVLFVFMGISGFISTRGTSFTYEFYRFLSEDAFVYIMSVVLIAAGLGVILDLFVKGMPAQVGRISGIVLAVFWIVVIIFKDFTTLGKTEMVDFVQSFIIDLLILFSVLQATVFYSKK